MKVVSKKIPLAAGSTAAILYLVCIVLTSIGAGNLMLKLFNLMMHGIDVNAIWAPNISLIGAILGIIATFVVWYAIGWVFTVMLKTFADK